jgi:hypothetical protein
MVWSSKDAEIDDHLHNPSPHDALLDARRFKVFSSRGWANMGALVLLFGGLITFFAGYPIISEITKRRLDSNGAWNLGGINASGQVPNIPNLPSLIDAYTPMAARTRTGYDGQSYDLVFSDEFEVEGRTFWPGDDPFWEAVDLHYWATGDYEWYDPDAVTTKVRARCRIIDGPHTRCAGRQAADLYHAAADPRTELPCVRIFAFQPSLTSLQARACCSHGEPRVLRQ